MTKITMTIILLKRIIMKYIFIILLLGAFTVHAHNIDEIAEYLTQNNSHSLDSEQLEALWKKYYNSNLIPIQEWAGVELDQKKITDYTLFYPFSGPDVVHMVTLFPKCKKYIMVGLEPAGNIQKIKIENINLDKLAQGIYSLLRRSFFITKDMWSDFDKPNNGVIIPIIVLLKKLNYTIVNVEQVILTKNGEIEPCERGNGVKLQVQSRDKRGLQEIYYISTSLMNKTAMEEFLDQQESPIVTYLKAAQYTLFDYRFIPIRDAILRKSYMILQDDSGIPFRYFNKDWKKELYGQYAGPYGESFKAYKQLDLLHIYSTITAKPIPFRLGYGYGKVPSCLMKMIRNDT